MFFSASSVLGSRPGSVGVGVSGCPGCAWVFNSRVRSAAPSLAVALPQLISSGSVTAAASALARRPGISSVTVRRFGGRVFLRLRGTKPALASAASWWVRGS